MITGAVDRLALLSARVLLSSQRMVAGKGGGCDSWFAFMVCGKRVGTSYVTCDSVI